MKIETIIPSQEMINNLLQEIIAKYDLDTPGEIDDDLAEQISLEFRQELIKLHVSIRE